MIVFYFSGTGNSKYIAELFRSYADAKCCSIEEDTDFSKLIVSEKTIGFCYPVYGSRVPKLMREFVVKHSGMLIEKDLIIFCTQMIFSGDGARALTDLFPAKKAKVIYAEHFIMPNNVCNLFLTPLDSDKKVEKCVTNAQRKMKLVCGDITAGKQKRRGFNPVSRFLGLFQGLAFPSLERSAMSKVWIDKDCNTCLQCVLCCPMGNFEHMDNKITTKNNCMMCYRCINKCPQKAISVFLRGKVIRQYRGIQ